MDRMDEAAGVHWHIEEVSRLWVQRPMRALQQHFMQRMLYLDTSQDSFQSLQLLQFRFLHH